MQFNVTEFIITEHTVVHIYIVIHTPHMYIYVEKKIIYDLDIILFVRVS